MCLTPLHLKNRKIDLDVCNDRLYVTVPCGKCAQCIAQKIVSWKNRLYIEYRDCRLKGNSVFMVTLTYNDNSVPYYDGKFCNSKSDVQKFLKRFRKNTGWKFKYLITSEFGELHGRIHYHGIFFCQQKIDPHEFYYKLRDCWQNGFVTIGKNQYDHREIESIAALGYVAKYICKDSFVDIKSVYPKDIYRKFFKNFILASNGIGMSIMDTSYVDILNGTMQIPVKNGMEAVPLPLYFIRKLYYNVEVSTKTDIKGNIEYDDNGKPKKRVLYRINDLGIVHKLATFDKIISNKAQKISSFVKMNIDRLERITFDSDIKDTYAEIKHSFQCLRKYEYVKNYLLYQEVFKDRQIIEPFLLDGLKNGLNDDDFLDDCRTYYRYFLSRNVDPAFDSATLYNTLPMFVKFDRLTKYVQLTNNLIAYDNLTKSSFNYNVIQKFRYNSGEFKKLALDKIPDFDDFNNLTKLNNLPY